MWVWICPERPDIKNEHHSKETARILLHNHVAGVNVLGQKACPLEHELIDDGVPCRMAFCGAPYVRNGHQQLEFFDKTVGKGVMWFWVCPATKSRNDFRNEQMGRATIRSHEEGKPHLGIKACFYNHVLRKIN